MLRGAVLLTRLITALHLREFEFRPSHLRNFPMQRLQRSCEEIRTKISQVFIKKWHFYIFHPSRCSALAGIKCHGWPSLYFSACLRLLLKNQMGCTRQPVLFHWETTGPDQNTCAWCEKHSFFKKRGVSGIVNNAAIACLIFGCHEPKIWSLDASYFPTHLDARLNF